jgi:hypothetical protein
MTGKKTGAPPAAALVRPVATGILIGSAFLLIFLFALHKPAPHGVPVGVVGPVSVSATIPAGSGLDLRTLGSTAQARQEIKHNTIDAAYVVQGGHYQLLVSSAHGSTAYHALEGIFTGIAAAHGAQLQVTDVVPSAPADPNGVSIFYLIFGVTLGAFLFGQTSLATGRHLAVRQKLLQVLAFSVLLGVIAALIARVWIQVLPGSLAAEGGVLVLLAASISVFTLAVTSLLGQNGVPVVIVVGLLLGMAISGAQVPADFLPSGFAFFSSALPPGATVTALRDIAYYDAGQVAGPLLVLVAWLVIGTGVAVAAGRERVARAQAPAPKCAGPTPGSRCSCGRMEIVSRGHGDRMEMQKRRPPDSGESADSSA